MSFTCFSSFCLCSRVRNRLMVFCLLRCRLSTVRTLFGLQWSHQPDHRGFRMKPDSSAKFKIRSLGLPHLQAVIVFSSPGCRLLLVPGFLPPEEADWIFSQLLAELPWSQKTNYRQGVFGMNENAFICVTPHQRVFCLFKLSLISAGLHHLSVAAVFLLFITASMFDNWSFISGSIDLPAVH